MLDLKEWNKTWQQKQDVENPQRDGQQRDPLVKSGVSLELQTLLSERHG